MGILGALRYGRVVRIINWLQHAVHVVETGRLIRAVIVNIVGLGDQVRVRRIADAQTLQNFLSAHQIAVENRRANLDVILEVILKLLDIHRHLRAIRAERFDPDIPTAAVSATLFLGALLRIKSFLQLQAETGRLGWQRLMRWGSTISDDTLARASERYLLEDLRQVLARVNKTLKSNKPWREPKSTDF